MTWHPDVPHEYRNAIVTGDARELSPALPDESVDLIFTDPVYDRIEDYRWLAETAARVLKPGGLCVAYYWGRYLPKVIGAMQGCDLIFRQKLSDLKIGVASLDGGNNGRILTRPALAYSKEYHRKDHWLDDLVYSRPMGKSINHKWSKNPSATIAWLSQMPGDIIFDPFTGGGTVPAVCKMLGRNYVAFEIDAETAEDARERVRNTQPPLFTTEPEPEQMELLP